MKRVGSIIFFENNPTAINSIIACIEGGLQYDVARNVCHPKFSNTYTQKTCDIDYEKAYKKAYKKASFGVQPTTQNTQRNACIEKGLEYFKKSNISGCRPRFSVGKYTRNMFDDQLRSYLNAKNEIEYKLNSAKNEIEQELNNAKKKRKQREQREQLEQLEQQLEQLKLYLYDKNSIIVF